MPSRLEHKRLTSFDGTELAYYVGGGDGPTVVLANGLGGPLTSYKHIVRQLGDQYRILSWDYRGLYHSGRPPNPYAVHMDAHIRDLELLMHAESVDKAIVLGWSMGVQVAFEYYRRHPEQVAGLAVLCGVAGRPFSTVLGGPIVGSMIPPLMELGKLGHPLVRRAAGVATAWPGLVPLMQRVGLVAPSLDLDIFREIANEFLSLDVWLYCETLRRLGEHDAHDVLPKVDVPTLIIAGARDPMTPRHASEHMQQEIPNARLRIVDEGTHYTPVEFPEIVEEELDRFLSGIPGFEPASLDEERSA